MTQIQTFLREHVGFWGLGFRALGKGLGRRDVEFRVYKVPGFGNEGLGLRNVEFRV